MTNKVITISRQFGSGGRTIGKKVAEKLGIPYYDKELVDQVAKESGFSHEFIEEIGEYASVTSSFLFNIAVSAHPMGLIDTMSVSDKLYVCQTNVIRDLAAKGPCVIVGRCADFILKDHPDTLHIFIHSDMEHRAERIVRLYGETKQTPQKRLQERQQAQGLLQALHQLQLGRSGKLRPLPRLWHVGRRQVRRYHLRRRADAVTFVSAQNPAVEASTAGFFYSIFILSIVPFGLYVDGKDDAERGELVLFLQNLEAVAVLKRGPRLFDARDHPFSLRDGKVEAHEAARNLPRKRIDRVALGKERKVPVQLHAPAWNSQLI